MPHMDGYQSTQRIRQFCSYHMLQQPNIIAVTGHTEQSYIAKALDSGINLVLSKPIEVD